MADPITARITDTLVTALENIDGTGSYVNTVLTVEQERLRTWLYDGQVKRWPLIEVAGPLVEFGPRAVDGVQANLDYLLSWYEVWEDARYDDTPVAAQADTVIADMWRAVMADVQRTEGSTQLATMTEILDAGYDIEVDDNEAPVLTVAMTVRVTTRIDAFDPTALG